MRSAGSEGEETGSTRTPEPRVFLFLQGPHGFFFPRLGKALRARGARVLRVNFNGGDWATWPGGHAYHGTPAAWPDYLTRLLRREQVSGLVLYGDCRPHHAAAIARARAAGVRVHVIEEGYLRPDWVTVERDGVNGFSRLPAEPAWYLATAQRLPPPAPPPPPLPSYAAARRWAAFFYYAQVVLQRWRFPFGPDHRNRNPVWEGITYLAKFRRVGAEAERSERALATVAGKPFMLFPLQLDSDAQIRIHSSYPGMREAVRAVLASFARHAPADMALIVKEHPLESGLIDWPGFFARAQIEFGLAGRLAFVEQGELDALVAGAVGVVTVNSTTGPIALAAGKPVKALGRAIFDMPGLTDQQPLDAFWRAPTPPDVRLVQAFERVLVDRVLIRGAFLSDEGAEALVEGTADRLLSDDPR